MQELNNVGDTGNYIQDYNFKHLFELPKRVALAWVKARCPDFAKHLTLDNMTASGWLNKRFVIVEIESDRKYAITNWDGRFSLYGSPKAL